MEKIMDPSVHRSVGLEVAHFDRLCGKIVAAQIFELAAVWLWNHVLLADEMIF